MQVLYQADIVRRQQSASRSDGGGLLGGRLLGEGSLLGSVRVSRPCPKCSEPCEACSGSRKCCANDLRSPEAYNHNTCIAHAALSRPDMGFKFEGLDMSMTP